eukprot:NODE_7828_length_383_cov_48.362275_g6125_i0.p2 GENE.NODE_7828_length_383_cov_48.362275_g6125_i0~~NODE_7828_length_383_cov_48.362275_g6125_i0.p2  ORF type:complete len:104 (+),score=43.32 NODE_7828_length_383_cov_48.362275_g6125_i0:30-314(+)
MGAAAAAETEPNPAVREAKAVLQAREDAFVQARKAERLQKQEDDQKKSAERDSQWMLERRRVLREIEEKEDDLLAFLDEERFGKGKPGTNKQAA